MRALLKVGFSLLLLAFVLIGLSYSMLRANGVASASEGRQVASETRPVPAGITAVDLNGPIDLTLRYGATPSLKVRGEARLLGNVDVTREGAILHVGIRGMVLRHRRPLEVELVLPSLASVTVDGSGDSTVNGFSGERIEVRMEGPGSLRFNGRFRQVNAALSGSGELDLNAGAGVDRFEAALTGSGSLTIVGSARELHATASGSGELDARHLRAASVEVGQTGSGSSTVQARQRVKASISGSGDIEVFGNPAERSISRSGSGSVTFPD
ncbi:head GIN domain-containing protein [Massilia consociata]|uniref:Head GIN domain-containing protein n=2 Tax=Pseudomonadati TaxID=3379134 RepID=A0ABV6FEB1_9BURK